MKKLIYLFLALINLSSAQTINWVSLSSEITGNIVWGLSVHNNSLIACGWFNMAGTVNANVIAAWNGTTWSNLGGGFRTNDVGHETITFNNELYLGGDFDSIGNIEVNNIAKWNGSSWSPLGSGANGPIRALAVYNNELYAAGSFSVIGGVTTNGVARWDGTNWNALANGLTSPAGRDLFVYNSSIYVVGNFYVSACTPCHNLAGWNGTTWSGVGTTGLPAANSALIEWNSKLLSGSSFETSPPTGLTEIRQWDGANLTMFSKQNSVGPVQKFYIFNSELYCSGGGGPTTNGESLVSKWSTSTSTWIPVGTGPNQFVTALCEYNGELYCGGMFNTLQQSNLNLIGRLTNVNGLSDLAKDWEIKVFPNPVNDKLSIEVGSNSIKSIYLTDPLGKVICEYPPTSKKIDLGILEKGVYFLNLTTADSKQVSKIIKE